MENPSDKPSDEQKKKRPYKPPQILDREKLEVVAAICNPAPPGKTTRATCRVNGS